MQWGTFTPAHLVSILAAVAMIAGLYFALRKAPQRVQTWVLGILSFSGIAAIVYNLIMWEDPLSYLPLHLCSLNAMVLPFAVFTKNKTLGNLLLVWSLGALIAIVLNQDVSTTELFSWVFNFYYFPHVLEFGIPILLFALGHVKKEPKCILSTIGITMAVYTVIHFINLAINSLTDVTVNYMFSVDPSFNPVLGVFYSIIPYEYWYMYAIIPILVVYLGIVYLPQLLQLRKK